MSQTIRIQSASPEQTHQVGAVLAKQLRPGSVVAFFGPLGAGKTCLIQGICQALGAKIPASSPSFVMINHYPGEFQIYHLDLYRLKKAEELLDLGFEEYIAGDGICLIEWADKAPELLPKKRWEVQLKIVSDNIREILVKETEGK